MLLGIVDRRKGKVYEDILNELEEIALEDKTLRTAFESWEKISSTREEAIAYESRMKRILDEESIAREMELTKEEISKIQQEITD